MPRKETYPENGRCLGVGMLQQMGRLDLCFGDLVLALLHLISHASREVYAKGGNETFAALLLFNSSI